MRRAAWNEPSVPSIAHLICACLLFLAMPAIAANGTPDAAQVVSREVVIRKGDTLRRIAARTGVSVDDLRKWNKGRIGKHNALKAGRKLVIYVAAAASAPGGAPVGSPKASGPTWEDSVRVQRGDTVGKIAAREGVLTSDLLRWNGLGAKAAIRAGQTLVLQRSGARPPAVSVGRPTSGRLSHGVHLGDGPGFRLRFPKNAYGTDTNIKLTRQCAKRVRDAFPGSALLLIGDLSRPGGGRFPPHEGHQSGRDVDVGYYLADNVQNATMHRVRADQLDYAKNWAYLKCTLQSGRVVRVFMDKRIQLAMAEWLTRKKTMDAEQLHRLFGALGNEDALVRHAPKHDTHLHVRYACDAPGPADPTPDTQANPCLEEDGDLPFTL